MPGFVLRDGDIRRLEAELAALDPMLRELAGSSARIDRHLMGSPGRHFETRRTDGVTIGLVISAILRGPLTEAPVRYFVVPFAWTELGGERLHWRDVPQWTIELFNAEVVEEARANIAEAWRQATSISRARILSAASETSLGSGHEQ